MRMTIAAGVLVVAAGVGVVGAQRQPPPPPPPNPLSSIPTFRCSFPKHVSTELVGAVPVPLAGEEEFTFLVADVNMRRGAARIVGSGGGSAEVTAILTATGLTVIEQTGLGNFIVTTIFTAGGADRVFRAVHSRHLGDLSAPPSVSQHFGTCQPVR
jgi:hypothetical protein